MKKICRISVLLLASATLFAGCSKDEKKSPSIHQEGDDPQEEPTYKVPVVGETIPAWTKGELDIHFINTSMGECAFIILPDATQLLVDAAGVVQPTGQVSSAVTNTGIRSRWDPTKEAGFDCGAFIEEYINKCMAWSGNNTIDYAIVTHFHNDHYGSHLGRPASKNSSTYRQQSFLQILDDMKVGLLLDRGYPNYDYPKNLMNYYTASSESSVYNYITGVRWLVANKGLKAEKFDAGSNTQIKPLYDNTYACRIQNLSVNGEIWNGTGTGSTATFPDVNNIGAPSFPTVNNADKCPEENHVSCTFKLSYGQFDYFAGADLQYNGMSSFSWKDPETPVAMKAGQVEVMKADHHGVSNTNGCTDNKACAMKYLNPQCWIVNSWTDGHPREAVFESVTAYCPNMDVFITNTCNDMRTNYTNFNTRVKGSDGHVVVRVVDGGRKYYVLVLTDSDRKMTVKSVSGPYTSR